MRMRPRLAVLFTAGVCAALSRPTAGAISSDGDGGAEDEPPPTCDAMVDTMLEDNQDDYTQRSIKKAWADFGQKQAVKLEGANKKKGEAVELKAPLPKLKRTTISSICPASTCATPVAPSCTRPRWPSPRPRRLRDMAPRRSVLVAPP